MKRVISLVLMVTGFFLAGGEAASGQGTVPGGINYQAVARDSYGKEIVNTDIEVRFTIRSGSPTGAPVYQEVFTDVTTSRYGVFSLVIGKGDPVSGLFEDINWSTANHYLQVEVKFENNFMDMGTMQFMAVPYALYAGKSLEPGPAGPPGPKGDQGDPATDDQQLTYNRATKVLSLDNGGTARLDTIVAFRAANSSPITLLSKQQVKIIFDDCTTSPNYNDGGRYNTALGEFKPPSDGIYTFNVSIELPTSATVIVKVDNREEVIINSYQAAGKYMGSITLKLAPSNVITVWVIQTNAYDIPLLIGGYFSGFRVY
jgi:hypothetical protein